MEQLKLEISDIYHIVADNVAKEAYDKIMDCVASEYDSSTVNLQDLIKNTACAPPCPNMKPDVITYDGGSIVHEWFDKDRLLHREHDQPARVEYCVYEGYASITKMIWMRHGKKHRDYDMPAELEYEPEGPLIYAKWWNNGNLARDGSRPFVVKYCCNCCKPELECCVENQEIHENVYTCTFLENRPENLSLKCGMCTHVLLQKTIYPLIDNVKLQDMLISTCLMRHGGDMIMHHYIPDNSGGTVVACVEKYKDYELFEQIYTEYALNAVSTNQTN